MIINEFLINFLQTNILIWLIVTIASFKIGIYIYNKTGNNILFQPILIAYCLILMAVYFSNISYDKYYKNVEIIHFFLNTAVVGLALPLYKNLNYIKKLLYPICLTIILGSFLSLSITYILSLIFNMSYEVYISMLTKSITAPIAVIIGNKINAEISLMISFIIITGIIGSMFATLLFKIFNIKSEISQGFSLGLTSHVIGTTKAMEISVKATAFSIIGMILNGLFMSILLPTIINLLN